MLGVTNINRVQMVSMGKIRRRVFWLRLKLRSLKVDRHPDLFVFGLIERLSELRLLLLSFCHELLIQIFANLWKSSVLCLLLELVSQFLEDGVLA